MHIQINPKKFAAGATIIALILGALVFYQKLFRAESDEKVSKSPIEKIFGLFSHGISKQGIALSSLGALEKVAKFLPIEQDTKKEIETMDALAKEVLKSDGQTRTYLVLLQNNMELRPGGGFLGQYAIVKIKNGEVVSTFVEDANLLDQRIPSGTTPPYPFEKMMDIKNWKFRDSNFSPDFPTNIEKAKYFYRQSGGNNDFDGVVAVNADVLSHILKLTGPINVPGYPGEYTSDNAVLKLESQVEKDFEAQGISVENRKLILKKLAAIIVERLAKIRNIPRLSEFVLEELRNKNVMLNFKNPELQQLVNDVHWSGAVAKEWDGDYLMIVDANMGALKSDYYVRRNVSYAVDLTTQKPVATLNITYDHKATQGDWRTSDYHTYLRIYTPRGTKLLERHMVSYPNVGEELEKTYLGFIAHVLIGRQTKAEIKYELPENIKDNYRLLIQKQSGVGDIPFHVSVKSSSGEQILDTTLKKDLKFELK